MSTSRLNRGEVNGVFQREVAASMDRTGLSSLAEIVPSDVAVERYTLLDAPPQLAELRGGATPVTAALARSFDLANSEFGSAMDIPRRDADRDQTGQWQKIVGQLAARAVNLPISLITDILTSNPTTYDGQNLFDSDHEIGSSGSQRNDLTTTQIGQLIVSSTTGVTPEEMVDAIQAVAANLMERLDNAGEPMLEHAMQFGVMVPPELFAVTDTALHTNNLAGGQTNILTSGGATYRMYKNPRLTSSTQFYVWAMDHPGLKPFVVQEEVPAEVDLLGPESDYYKRFKRYQVMAYWRGNAGAAEPLVINRATLATS